MMKSLKLAVIASKVILGAVILSVSGLAQADATDRLNHHFTSKRAHQAPVDNKDNKADEQFEGATLVQEDENSIESKNARTLKQLKINSLSRRSYME